MFWAALAFATGTFLGFLAIIMHTNKTIQKHKHDCRKSCIHHYQELQKSA